jgi:hypothetical protein
MLFELDADTKRILHDASTLFGVKTDIIQDIWEYTAFAWALNLMECKGNYKMRTFTVPFLGRVGVKYDGEEVDDKGNLVPKVDTFLNMSDGCKKLVADAFEGDQQSLINYIRKNFLERAIEDVQEDVR